MRAGRRSCTGSASKRVTPGNRQAYDMALLVREAGRSRQVGVQRGLRTRSGKAWQSELSSLAGGALRA